MTAIADALIQVDAPPRIVVSEVFVQAMIPCAEGDDVDDHQVGTSFSWSCTAHTGPGRACPEVGRSAHR